MDGTVPVARGYAPEAWAGLVHQPVDRTAAVRAAFESLGGPSKSCTTCWVPMIFW
jgi:hypothetical protein